MQSLEVIVDFYDRGNPAFAAIAQRSNLPVGHRTLNYNDLEVERPIRKAQRSASPWVQSYRQALCQIDVSPSALALKCRDWIAQSVATAALAVARAR